MSFPPLDNPLLPSNMSRINVLSGAQNVVVSGAVNVAETISINYNLHLGHRMISGAASTEPQTTPSIQVQCITCNRHVYYSPVKSNANGNQLQSRAMALG